MENVATEQKTVHPLQKSYTVISTKHVDFDNLTAIEATAMAFVLVLAPLGAAMWANLHLVA